MRWFSERHGFTLARDTLQIEELELGTRRRIWNLLSNNYFHSAKDTIYAFFREPCQELTVLLWDRFFKWTHDSLMSTGSNGVYKLLREQVTDGPWNRVYDLIEATIEYSGIGLVVNNFIDDCNEVLEEEKCGYRIISRLITPIISTTEISEIDEALSHPFDNINQHLYTALELLSDRTSPNYPNSVKEAISAVECICRIIVAERNITLGTALNRLEDLGVVIHGAFRKGISSLYGWTSVDGGIRHARVDDSEIGFDEAKMMIVLCSAFVNYLKTKAENADIDLLANYSEIKDG